MGLGDIYTSDFAQSLARGPEQRMKGAFDSLPGLQQQGLQADAMKQANTDAAYNSPARPANEHETAIAEQYRKLVGMDDPNVPPEFIQRFHAEARGGMGARQPQPSYNGPMAASPAMPNPDNHMSAPASQGGYGLNTPLAESPRSMMSMAPVQGRQGLSSGPQRPSPQPTRPMGPMTNGDVSKYMATGPVIAQEMRAKAAAAKPPPAPARDYLGEIALRAGLKGDEDRKTDTAKTENKKGLVTHMEAFKDKRFNTAEAHRWQADIWAHEDRLAAIEARVKLGTATSADNVALHKYLGEIAASVKIRSSIPEIADDKEAKSAADELETRAKQSLIEMEKQKTQSTTTTTGSSSTKTPIPRSEVKRQPQGTEANKALQWARANPNDPRSSAILKKLGLTK